jgi:hypothetical protein
MHIFNMSKIRHNHREYDTRGWFGTKPGPNRDKMRPASQVFAPFQILFCQHVMEGWCTGYPMPKVGSAMKLGRSATLADRPAWQVPPPEPHFQPKHQINPSINTPYSAPKFILCRVEREEGSEGRRTSWPVRSPRSSSSAEALPESVRIQRSFSSSSSVEWRSSAGIPWIPTESRLLIPLVYWNLSLPGYPRHYLRVGDLPIIVSHLFASLMLFVHLQTV